MQKWDEILYTLYAKNRVSRFAQCSDRSESVRNRKYTKFLIDMVCPKNFQLRKFFFFDLKKKI